MDNRTSMYISQTGTGQLMESKEFGLRNRVMTTRKWFWTKRHQYNSHIPNPKVWDPNGNGWEMSNDGYLKPLMYTNELAPLEVRNLTHVVHRY